MLFRISAKNRTNGSDGRFGFAGAFNSLAGLFTPFVAVVEKALLKDNQTELIQLNSNFKCANAYFSEPVITGISDIFKVRSKRSILFLEILSFSVKRTQFARGFFGCDIAARLEMSKRFGEFF